MKKNALLFISLFICALTFAQNSPMSVSKALSIKDGSRDVSYDCLPGSVFSQVFPGYNDGYFCDSGNDFTAVADDYSASAPFSSMRFWGLNWYGGEPGANQTFKIDFYDGPPGSGGTLVSSYTKTVTPQPTGNFAPWGTPTEIYMVDFDLGTNITLLNGWFSLSRINPGDNHTFTWIALDGAGNAMSYFSTINYWMPAGYAVFFCLSGEKPPVPVSDWALIFGLILIGTFIFIRHIKS